MANVFYLAAGPVGSVVLCGRPAVVGERGVAGGRGDPLHPFVFAHYQLGLVLPGHVLSACVTPDGQHVVTASEDNTARVWLLVEV